MERNPLIDVIDSTFVDITMVIEVFFEAQVVQCHRFTEPNFIYFFVLL